MVRTISAAALAAVLSSTLLAGAAPVDEVAETCQTSAVGATPPEPLPAGTSCQERAFDLEMVVYALGSHVRGLLFRVMDLRWRLDQKRKVIRHLRAELRDARRPSRTHETAPPAKS